MKQLYYFSFFLLVWLPLSFSLTISAPEIVEQCALASIKVTWDASDVPTVFLKKYRLDENKFADPVFPVDRPTTTEPQADVTTQFPFFKSQRYIVVSVANPQIQTLSASDIRSNVITVNGTNHSECDEWKQKFGGGGGGFGGGNHENHKNNNKSDNQTGSTSTRDNTGMIVGIVFGVMIILVLLAGAAFWYIRRRRRFQPNRMVRQSSSLDSFRQYVAEKYANGPMTPSMISADPYGYLQRPSPPPPNYPSIYETLSRPPSVYPGKSIHRLTMPSTITSMPASPFTDRQMQIHHRLFELQEEMIRLERRGDVASDNAVEAAADEVDLMHTKAKIAILRDFLDSAWAMHRTDDLPQELRSCF